MTRATGLQSIRSAAGPGVSGRRDEDVGPVADFACSEGLEVDATPVAESCDSLGGRFGRERRSLILA